MRRIQLLLISLTVLLIWQGCTDNLILPEEPPKITLPSKQSVITNEEFDQNILVQDPQGLEVDLIVEGLPSWLEFYPEERLLRGVPGLEDIGLYELVIEADNGFASSKMDLLLRVFRDTEEAGLQAKVENATQRVTPGLKGVSVAILDQNENIYQAYNGISGFGITQSPLRETTMFRVASVTKPMTTTLILKLVDKGLLDLDDLLSEHLETRLPYADRMTIRQMLSHTAGVFNHLGSQSFWSHSSYTPSRVWTVEELVEFAVRNGPLFSPGFSYSYSNTAFCVLGAVVEEMTGLDIEKAYRQFLFDPLGLDATIYDNFSTPNNTIPDLAVNSRTYEYHLSSAGAAGAMVATPTDVVRFGRLLYGGHFLSQELTEKLSINLGEPLGGQNYGLGTRIWHIGGIPHHGHTGALMDYRNILMYIPQADLTVAINTHDVHSNWFVLIDEIFEYAVHNFSDGLAKTVPFIHGAEPRDEFHW